MPTVLRQVEGYHRIGAGSAGVNAADHREADRLAVSACRVPPGVWHALSACASPRRALDDAVSSSTIRPKRASTIAEMYTLGKARLADELMEVDAMRKTGSAILEAVHHTARGLHKAGVMDRDTLREFDRL